MDRRTVRAVLTRSGYSGFKGAPDPLAFAFIGPLVGSLIRVAMGPPSDKWGGGIWTTVSGVGLLACALGTTAFMTPTSMSEFPYFLALMVGLFLFAGIGNASTFRQIPIIFSGSPRQGAGVLGWTAAVAAYGPFMFASLIGLAITQTGSPNIFFYAIAVFYAINIGLNWWYYTRPRAERPS